LLQNNFDSWFPAIPGSMQTNKDTNPKDFQWVYCNITTRIITDHVSTNQTPNYVKQNYAISTLCNLVIRLSVCIHGCHKILLKKQEMVFFQKLNNHGQNKPLTILPITTTETVMFKKQFWRRHLKSETEKNLFPSLCGSETQAWSGPMAFKGLQGGLQSSEGLIGIGESNFKLIHKALGWTPPFIPSMKASP